MPSESNFQWPNVAAAAVTLTFDDAWPSQVMNGVPILNEFGFHATFFASFNNFEPQIDLWRDAMRSGHEIANHTVLHPCSGNHAFARHKALEDYTLDRMEEELLTANARWEELVGRRPTTFAYPCGHTFVGRGENLCSYVPLVAKHFLAGRGYRNEAQNDPAFCDLAHAMGLQADGVPVDVLIAWIRATVAEGRWLILVAHEVADVPTGRSLIAPTLHFPAERLRAICECLTELNGDVWVDTFETVASWLKTQRADNA